MIFSLNQSLSEISDPSDPQHPARSKTAVIDTFSHGHCRRHGQRGRHSLIMLQQVIEKTPLLRICASGVSKLGIGIQKTSCILY